MVRHQLSPVFAPERDLFGDIFRPFIAAPRSNGQAAAWAPPAEVLEYDDSFFLTLETSGINPDDIEITLEGKTLTVKGDRKAPELPDGAKRHIDERRYGSFSRSFTFPVDVVANGGIEAKAKDGILGIRVAKVPASQPQRIPVQQG